MVYTFVDDNPIVYPPPDILKTTYGAREWIRENPPFTPIKSALKTE
jgi:hypothetical protein